LLGALDASSWRRDVYKHAPRRKRGHDAHAIDRHAAAPLPQPASVATRANNGEA
jgi:hypothetical protein